MFTRLGSPHSACCWGRSRSPRLAAMRCSAALVLALVLAGCQPAAETARPITLQGAGATFPTPLYELWIDDFVKRQTEIGVEYQSVGSGAGIERFLAEKVDFGASDSALKDEQIDAVARGGLLIPTTAGSIVIAYNVPGLPDGLKLPRDVYADIFLAKIKEWNDPRIASANPGVNLPKLPIKVAVRADGSGTTHAFTRHLAAISSDWAKGPGAGKSVTFPGKPYAANGNEGVMRTIKEISGTVGYVSYGEARRAGLRMASLENKAGKFIQPDGHTGSATITHFEFDARLRADDPDPVGEDSYPIVTMTWLLVYKEYDAKRQAPLLKFLRYCLTDAQELTDDAGYLRLPKPLVERALAELEQVKAK